MFPFFPKHQTKTSSYLWYITDKLAPLVLYLQHFALVKTPSKQFLIQDNQKQPPLQLQFLASYTKLHFFTFDTDRNE